MLKPADYLNQYSLTISIFPIALIFLSRGKEFFFQKMHAKKLSKIAAS